MQNSKAIKTIALLMMVLLLMPTSAMFASQLMISNEAERHILGELNRVNIPNAAIAVMQNGETTYILKDSGHDSLFQIGSVSKSFTAFGVLLLEDMGLISVTDPVNMHLPWFYATYSGAPATVTVYNLLHHTSGFTSDERRFPESTAGVVADDIIAQLAGIELQFYPSTDFQYANINYVILGLLIETVYGRSYDEFMTQNVLHPLGLYNTFTDTQRAHETGRVAGGNRLGFLRPRAHNLPVSPRAVPTGFIYSDISDMARWVGIHLGTVEVLAQFARVVERSHSHNHTDTNPFVDDASFFYAAGWFVNHRAGYISHGGLTPGYATRATVFPSRDTAVVILINLSYNTLGQFEGIVLNALNHGRYNRAAMDLNMIIDISLTILVAIGVIVVFMFVRLTVRLYKSWRGGGCIKVNITAKNMAWLIMPIIATIFLIFLYIIPPIVFGTSNAVVAAYAPSSIVMGDIAIWVIVAYAWCSWLARIFFNLKVQK